jgi:hypothetical protein
MQQTVFFIVKSKPTAIFTVVFRGVSVQNSHIGLDVQVSLGHKDFLSKPTAIFTVVFRGVSVQNSHRS